MANTSVCNDISEATELDKSQSLYLKPIAKLNVCVQLPQLKQPGKSISNWEVMEKIKRMAKPHSFISLKIFKSTLDFIRLEGEVDNKSLIKTFIMRLDSKTIKLAGFPEMLKVKSAEAKINFPTRHVWDSYFRDAKNMNEMKSGERPDTIHLKELPCRWFSRRRNRDIPDEQILKKVFTNFGEVRCVDIPMLDPYRKEMTKMGRAKPGSIQTFSYGQDLVFEAYVQYKEYIGFVKAMDSLRGMKLLYMEDDEKPLEANIKVDFDKTKHLSDKAIRKRRLERQKLEELEREREEKVRREREEEERKQLEEKLRKQEEERERERKRLEKIQKRKERQEERERKRKQKSIEKRKKEEERRMQMKIAVEERKLLLAQRKLESIRLLSHLFERVKVIKLKEDLEKKEKELEEQRKRELEQEAKEKLLEEKHKIEAKRKRKLQLERQEKDLREKILKNFKVKEEKEQENIREELRKKLSGKVKLKSAVIMKR